jgi:hypothetical protein
MRSRRTRQERAQHCLRGSVGKAGYEERQQRKAAERAAAEQRARRRALIWRGAIAGLVVIAIAMSYSFYRKSRLLGAVTTTNYPFARHVSGAITYTETPPMGGPHNVVWQTCGIYDAPIHNEHGVHSLEHGAIWITYRPGLPADQLERLKTLAADDYMLLSPYPDLPHAIVASAWNHQLTFERADDPALTTFIAEFKNNPDTTPEFGASCLGGTKAPATADTLTNAAGAMQR